MTVYRVFFFTNTASTAIYTLSLHDALPILAGVGLGGMVGLKMAALFPDLVAGVLTIGAAAALPNGLRELLGVTRSEEHTSELQSQSNLVCRLLLVKKKPKGCLSHRY